MSEHYRSGRPNHGCTSSRAIKEGHERDSAGVCALCGDGPAAPAAAQLDADLPPPPAPEHWYYCCGEAKPTDGYTLEQMHDFARQHAAQYAERIRHLERELAERDETPEPRRCKACHSPRKGETCHKCGDPTFVPHASWEEPALPPVDRIRELAREVGYAIGEHGTKERDLDLIAAPWTEEAIGNAALFEHIAKGLGARVVDMERKPLGRYAATLQMDGWYKNIDLSVCPFDGRTASTAPAAPVECTQAMLESAMKAAVAAKLFPKFGGEDAYLSYWSGMKASVNAALAAAPSPLSGTEDAQ
jgi:hypothetical protein